MNTHRVLHFAPEECFYKLLKAQSKSYEPVDYSPSTLGVKARFADVTSLDFARCHQFHLGGLILFAVFAIIVAFGNLKIPAQFFGHACPRAFLGF